MVLAPETKQYEKAIYRLQQSIDRSKRVMNPKKYKPDGTSSVRMTLVSETPAIVEVPGSIPIVESPVCLSFFGASPLNTRIT